MEHSESVKDDDRARHLSGLNERVDAGHEVADGLVDPLPRVRTYLVADVICLWCGRVAGAVEQERGPTPGAVFFRVVAGQDPIVVTEGRIRCARCGGPTLLGNMELVRRRFESRWQQPRRRGRPRKSSPTSIA